MPLSVTSFSALFSHQTHLDYFFLTLVRSQVVSFEFFIKSFRSHYGPGVDSASNRNEYKEYILVVKAAGAYG